MLYYHSNNVYKLDSEGFVKITKKNKGWIAYIETGCKQLGPYEIINLPIKTKTKQEMIRRLVKWEQMSVEEKMEATK